MSASSRVLAHKVNLYNSVEITDPRMRAALTAQPGSATQQPPPPLSPPEFESLLWESLRVWRKEGRKGIWLTLGPGAADLVPVAVRAGFQFHRAEPGFLTLTAWLPSDQVNRLPPGPSHFIGVAGFVQNSRGEVLVIREKSGPAARAKNFWKLPGGLVDSHEDLRDAVVREVLEETGLRTRFLRLATLQEIHHKAKLGGPAREGTSDIYCICILAAEDENAVLTPQEEEIAACKWMPLQELLAHPFYARESTIYGAMHRSAAAVAARLREAGEGAADAGLDAMHLPFGVGDTSMTLYGAGLKKVANSKL